MLDRLNQKILSYAEHPYALILFSGFCFLCGSFVPVPPDPLFVVLAMQQPQRILLLILIGAVFVTLGGLVMYGIGYGLYCSVGVWLIQTYHWGKYFDILKTQLDLYGMWIIILKAFTPIPYKLLALIAGVGNYNLSSFVIASLIGRSLRFGIEALVLRLLGERMRTFIQQYLSLGVALAFVAFLLLTFFSFLYL